MTIDDRLENWGRYYRDRQGLKTCGSVEKHYHAPWRQWVDTLDIPIPNPIDMWDAQRVESAWKQLLGRHKALLRYAYMHSFPDWVVAKKTGVKIYRLDNELRRAKLSIESVLTRFDVSCISTPNLRKTPCAMIASGLEAFAPLKETEPA